MQRPDLTKIVKLFKAGENFNLTNSEYKRKTGRDLPQDAWYLRNNSSVAKKAREYGYKIKVVERTILFEKE